MDSIDLAFFSGDNNLIKKLILSKIYLLSSLHEAEYIAEIHSILEAIFAIEATAELKILFKLYPDIWHKLQPYDQFRILQWQGNPKAFSLLAQYFDDINYVKSQLERSETTDIAIIVYELGGLGDYIEGICLVKELIASCCPHLRVQVRIPTDLSKFLQKYFSSQHLQFIECEWNTRKIPGSIHLLSLTAIARNHYNLTPRSLTQQPKLAPTLLITKLLKTAFHNRLDGYLVWNSQSQPKLRPINLRRSYFHRSINQKNWTLLSKQRLDKYIVLDISEYPSSWNFGHLSSNQNYLHMPAQSFTFEELAALCQHAAAIHTIDSMLGHLSASLGLKFDLLLAQGHEQRWFIDYSNTFSMYTQNATIWKQTKLHHWQNLEKAGPLSPVINLPPVC